MTAGARTAVSSAGELPPAEQTALRRHVLTLADSKRLLGIRYSDWVLGAPSLEANIATSAMAQDEWGHARLIYAMLKDFGDDPTSVEHDRDATEYANVDPLDGPMDDWAEVVAAMVVVDGALTVALEGFAAGRYEPARSRVPKMIAEEVFHRDLAHAWFRRIAGGAPEGRERLAGAVGSVLPRTLAWLAPVDEAFARLAAAGLVREASELADEYHGRLADLLRSVDIPITEVSPERDGWDEVRGRGPGHPAEEAVERARGDRNRALFVE